MVDSRAKGSRGEYLVRDLLRKHTGIQFERVPASGALSYLKGDLYTPHDGPCRFCIEVKNYEESPLNDKIFTNKSNNLIKWWEKIVRQAEGGGQEPLLMFKYNRSKVFVVTRNAPSNMDRYMYIAWLDAYVMLAEQWLEEEDEEWLKNSQS